MNYKLDKSVFLFTKSVIFLMLMICSLINEASHIRAGEITAIRTDDFTLTYEFTFTGIRDTRSSIEFGAGIFKFGDGTSEEGFQVLPGEPIAPGIEKVVFKLKHTFGAPGRYVVSYEEDFRNANIINMNSSDATAFYVESVILIDPFIGLNNTPTLTVPPIDFAAVGVKFEHNPGAQDAEGDSISYRFTTPKKNISDPVDGYLSLIDPDFYTSFATGSETLTAPKLTLDPVTGDLAWDSPGDAFVVDENNEDLREYNVAFVIEEWRLIAGEYLKISEITRDMQIIVEDTDNERPMLELPDDICVEAGDFIDEIITANDPDGDPVRIEAYGGPFESAFNQAKLDSIKFDGPPNFVNFTWLTECGHVRERPYEVQFKATDRPSQGRGLVDFETFKITVVGPAPTGLETEVLPGKSIQLSWDDYSCSNADKMQIWRRVGEFEIDAEECVVGMPPNSGYTLINTVEIGTTEFLDTNFGNGLSAGAKYCYRLVAKYPAPGGGTSYVSEAACDSLLIDVPVITNVDIRNTGNTNGEILVKWTPPYQIDQSIYPPNYTYDLFRSEGTSDLRRYTLIAGKVADTTFIDTGLDTFSKIYSYFVRFYDNGGVLVDSSAIAGAVRLELVPLIKSIEVNWSADVPWSLRDPNYKYHYIYRDKVSLTNPSAMSLIDSVEVTTSRLSYLDNGRFNDITLVDSIEYCYFVTTFGSYDNILLPEPLINRSQISCAQPNDTIPPCAPLSLRLNENYGCNISLNTRNCDSQFFINGIDWDVDQDLICDKDIIIYNIYFSPTGLEEDYFLLDNVSSTSYIHDDVNAYKGCYRVASVDRSGNESELTMEICSDSCPVYKLPNVFTPNGDGINDFFTPLYTDSSNPVSGFDFSNCPRFVKSVELSVTNRTGDEVFFYDSRDNENNILINWNAKNKAGIELESGVYFYSAKLVYDVLATSDPNDIVSGWVQILK